MLSPSKRFAHYNAITHVRTSCYTFYCYLAQLRTQTLANISRQVIESALLGALMIRNWTALAALVFLAGVGGLPSFAVDLTAGPMIGHVTDTSARLWMQFPVAGDVTINAFEVETSHQVS